jgi:hypothetical protein
MIERGRIGAYHWGEFWAEEPELILPEVVRELSQFLLDRVAMNISFDSGRLGTEVGPLPSGWRMCGWHAVSGPLHESDIAAWPESGFGFDEWYFFRSAPPLQSSRVMAWCNYGYSLRLRQWSVPQQFAEGFDLAAQLERVAPELVLGVGRSMYLLSQTEAHVDAFLSLPHVP